MRDTDETERTEEGCFESLTTIEEISKQVHNMIFHNEI